jgi:hypothetical protein
MSQQKKTTKTDRRNYSFVTNGKVSSQVIDLFLIIPISPNKTGLKSSEKEFYKCFAPIKDARLTFYFTL